MSTYYVSCTVLDTGTITEPNALQSNGEDGHKKQKQKKTSPMDNVISAMMVFAEGD